MDEAAELERIAAWEAAVYGGFAQAVGATVGGAGAADPVSLILTDRLRGVAGAELPDFDDVIGFIFGGPGDIIEKVGEMFKAVRDWLWNAVGGAVRWGYERTAAGATWALAATAELLGGLGGAVLAMGGWVWAQTERAFGTAGGWILSSAGWVWAQTERAFGTAGGWILSSAGWVWAQTERAFGTAGGWILSSAGWLWAQTERAFGAAGSALLTTVGWLWDNTRAAFDFAGGVALATAGWLYEQTTGAVLAGASAVVDGFQAAMGWVTDRIIGPIYDDVITKLNIPRQVFAGDYDSLEALWEDVQDPAPLVIAGLVGVMVLAMAITQILSGLTLAVSEPLTEAVGQRVRARIGATLPSPPDVMEALNREFIDEGKAYNWLRSFGYGTNAADMYMALRFRLPGASDLVRMGVREVWSPEIAERFGQREDFPPEFGVQMEKQGYTLEWAEAFWMAHWDLPSPNQGFEMLHRGVIEEADLDLLLRALDVMPFWRDQMKAIAYNPLTRVDVRRMHKLGMISTEELQTRYQDVGFSPENAAKMVEFTILYNDPDDSDEVRDLAASQVRKAYRRGIIDRDDALDRLVEYRYTEQDADFLLALDDVDKGLRPDLDLDLDVRELTGATILKAYRMGLWDRPATATELEAVGYAPQAADLLLAMEDKDRAEETARLQRTLIREQYERRILSRQETIAELSSLGTEPAAIAILVATWELEEPRTTRRLTSAQITRAHREGVFDAAGAMDELGELGYSDRDAMILLGIAGRMLSTGQVLALYKALMLSESDSLGGLLALGYNQTAAGLLLELAAPAESA